MDDLVFQSAIEPFRHAVTLHLCDEGIRRINAPELDLVGEVVRQIVAPAHVKVPTIWKFESYRGRFVNPFYEHVT